MPVLHIKATHYALNPTDRLATRAILYLVLDYHNERKSTVTCCRTHRLPPRPSETRQGPWSCSTAASYPREIQVSSMILWSTINVIILVLSADNIGLFLRMGFCSSNAIMPIIPRRFCNELSVIIVLPRTCPASLGDGCSALGQVVCWECGDQLSLAREVSNNSTNRRLVNGYTYSLCACVQG